MSGATSERTQQSLSATTTAAAGAEKGVGGGIHLSRQVLQQVFGPEFVSSLFSSPPGEEAQEGRNSWSSGELALSPSDKEYIHPPLSPVLTAPAANKDQLVIGKEINDGPSKPKSFKISDPTADLLQYRSEDEKAGSTYFLDRLSEEMKRQLNLLEEAERRQMDTVQQEGRLGPKVAKFDVASHVGSFIISTDRLGVSSQCNFGSVRACSCVFKGKWQYEVQLGSSGVMQVGWSTLETRFSQEKGVGDTIDSYAYDGNRLRKWNKSTAQYGETWQAGDIIGCCIDLDAGSIEFLRNGKRLGVAFTEIKRGPSIAYFPAVSLAFQENIVANFGATPLQFPVEGYNPIQSERTANNLKSSLLLSWLEKLLLFTTNSEFKKETMDHHAVLIITNRIMEFLGPHLHSGFVVEQSFYPFFAKILGLPEKISHTDKIVNNQLNYDKASLLMDFMWTFLEESEIKSCLERMCVVLMNQFRSNSMSLDYPFQQYSLLCLMALVKHRKTRRHFIRHLLLDRSGRLMHFLHIRPMDETVLKVLIPETWWPGKVNNETETLSSQAYESACNLINQQVSEIQQLQVLLLKILLINQDGTEKRPSSRALFLRKFRTHVRDVIRPGSVLHQPVQKAMCTFFCLLNTISELYAEEVDNNKTETDLPDLPSSLFYDTSLAYYDMERLGGLASYLYKTYHREISTKLSIPDYVQERPPPASAEPEPTSASTVMPGVIHVSTAVTTEDSVMTRNITMAELSPPDIIMTVPRVLRPPLINTSTPPTLAIGAPPPPPMPPAPVPPISSASVERRIGMTSTNIPPPAIGVIPSTETASAASSEETIASVHPQIPTFGALITGTPSGHNMLIPMMTDFRNMDQGFTFFPGGFVGFSSMEHRAGVQPQNPAISLLGKDSGSIDSLFSLRELLDDAIIIFNSGVQSNVEKVVSLRTTMDGYEEALKDANKHLDAAASPSEREEILKSIEIFTTKLDEQSRHMAWIKACVFTKERQLLVRKLLEVVLNCLNSSSAEGDLFTFVPEHYISTLVNLNGLITNHMHPTVSFENISDFPQVATKVAEFVSMHFADSRIVIAETKDTLTQALSTFICSRQMLSALENMPNNSQMSMIKSILRPYENRAWAQSNFMLVRMWQGDGFAFQYPNSLESRRSYRAKPVQDEFGISTNLSPTPSKIFQSHVANVLLDDQRFAVGYIHSVLNQLNWSFSEFVGLLQEIQTAANRPERVFVESRQLKICCTCFELSYSLLRVVEMIVSIAPPVLTDFSRDSSEPLLGRLAMLLSQVLNRIGSNTGSFSNVIELDIPGLENVTHFPVLSAVAGILVALIKPEVGKPESEIPATKTILGEPSFQVNSLDFFIGRNQSHVPPGKPIFSLINHVPEDVTESEILQLQDVIHHLYEWSERLLPEPDAIDEDAICTICYAAVKNATLKPCNHRTCKSCILHHLMNRGECFFCKAVIRQVILDDGTKIHDVDSTSTDPPAPSDREGRRTRL